jgi:hypothetical protein
MIYWANLEKVGVIILQNNILFYVDSGTLYEEAIKSGPLPMVDDYSSLVEVSNLDQ